ncbi:2636_t:CDS:1, partial [Racocetra persica]
KNFKIIIMSQPNQTTGNRPFVPPNTISVNSTFNDLTVEQKYNNLIKGIDLFTSAQETENQVALKFQDFILLGSNFG